MISLDHHVFECNHHWIILSDLLVQDLSVSLNLSDSLEERAWVLARKALLDSIKFFRENIAENLELTKLIGNHGREEISLLPLAHQVLNCSLQFVRDNLSL